MDLETITEELIASGKINYCFIRSDQWVYSEYYPVVYGLFKREIQLTGRDREIYDSINDLKFSEIKKAGFGEQEIRDSLIKLESAYMIRKEIHGEMQYYVKNDAIPEIPDNGMKIAVSTVLSSYGPLSLDELLIRLPVNGEELEQALNSMIRENIVLYDYITPIFMKQYMMKSDFEAIVNSTDEDIVHKRIINFCSPVEDVGEFFQKYGFAFDTFDIRVRTRNYRRVDLERMLASGEIYRARAIKNKYVLISKWLMDILYKLREEKNSDLEDQVLGFIQRGIDTDEKLSAMTGMEGKIIKGVLKNLEFKIAVIQGKSGEWHIYSPENDVDTAVIIEKYGPVTTRELARFFWFNPAKLDYSRFTPVYYRNEIYYGGQNLNPEPVSLITMKNDPVSIYMGRYVRNDDFNARFIHNGSEESMFYIEERPPGIWFDNIDFESGKINEFLENVRVISSKLEEDSIIIKTSNSDLLKAGESNGYSRSENVIYMGNFDVMPVNTDDLLSTAVQRYNSGKTTMNYNILSRIFLGIRSDMEAYYTGIRSVELTNYYNSMLIYNFDGPFNIPALGTKNVIALYKAIKKRSLTEAEEEVYKSLISRSMSENELIKSMKMNSLLVRESVKTLYKLNAIAKDKSRRYITVNDEYSKIEAIEILLRELINRIGFFDINVYRELTGQEDYMEYNLIVKKLSREKFIRETLIPSENRIIYAAYGLQAGNIKTRVSRIIPPKDIIALVFSGYIKSRYHSSSNYMYFADGAIKMSISVKKSGKYLSVKKIIGDSGYKDLAKAEFNSTGYILSN